jgi:DNA-binding GntR family transcriptional regulator
MNTIQIVEQIYEKLVEEISHGVIPVSLRLPSLVGTVQDDPFDSWI